MNQDKKRTYILSTLIGGFSALLLLLPIEYSRWQPICLFIPAALAVLLLIKKRSMLSINKYQVLLIVTVSTLLRIMLHYMLGTYFGMGHRSVVPTWPETLLLVASAVAIILPSELIRCTLVAQKHSWVSIMAYIIGVASDVLLETNLASFDTMNTFMDLVGMTLLPALIGNAVYHYLAKWYGLLPGLAMRTLLSLYSTVIPYVTFTPKALQAFGGFMFPIVVYLFVSLLYEHKKVTHRRSKKMSPVWTTLVVVLMLLTVMLISCQFRFGALVIGTPSMTGELNIGDVAVFERYEGQVLEVGDVVVFKSGNNRIIHRVVDINHIGNTLQYITQGDANEDPDMGHRTTADIVGVVHFKVAYVGYPTVWLNKLFSNAT